MDRAEIYLELNLFDGAVTIARRAYATFKQLGKPIRSRKMSLTKRYRRTSNS